MQEGDERAVKMAPFCMGSGTTMGTNGLKWAGSDPDDDCAMLWTQVFGVTSVGRAVIATVTVFLMALLAQYLTAKSGSKIQEAKEFAKQKRVSALVSSQYYDPEQGRGNGTSSNNGSGIPAFTRSPSLTASAAEKTTLLTSSQPSAEASGSSSGASQSVPTAITSVSVSSRSIPAPTIRTNMAIPAANFFSNININSNAPLPYPDAAKVSNWEHFCDSLQHGLRIFIAYLLMLAAMTYDVALIVSIVLGFTLGYFVFAQDTAKIPASADPCCS